MAIIQAFVSGFTRQESEDLLILSDSFGFTPPRYPPRWVILHPQNELILIIIPFEVEEEKALQLFA